jgi:hypothetical protein
MHLATSLYNLRLHFRLWILFNLDLALNLELDSLN